MNLTVSSTVRGVNEQNNIVNLNVWADDWTVKVVIIANSVPLLSSY